MKRSSQDGSAIIGVLVTLGIAAFAYVSTSTSFFSTLTKKKTKNQLEILSKSFTSGVFNYTAYAIKERWCMDTNWGRDASCSAEPDMKKVVTHPRNLERFLWSKVTLNDLGSRYQKLYGAAPSELLSLAKLEQTISMSDLEGLGVSHPLNLVIDETIKNCLSSVSITIEKPLASYYKPQGDEVYLSITVKGNLSVNLLNKCSMIKNTPVIKGLVIYYPKTLNQYALIKGEDLNVSDFGTSTNGVDFYGPVYVQRNLILPASGFHGIGFKDKVRIGDGILKIADDPFTPKTPGGLTNQYLSQISTMKGFLNGINLEAETDEGFPKLFGGTYAYPSNINMAMCKDRNDLKDNFSLTKNSRLWIKGSGGSFTFALSGSNEFREYSRHGANANGKYVYNSYSNNYNLATNNIKNQLDVDVTEQDNKPVMEAYVLVNGTEYSKMYLGRSSSAKITFAKLSFFTGQKLVLDTSDTTYLDYEDVDEKGMNIEGSTTYKLKQAYLTFEDECNDAKDVNLTTNECQKVIANPVGGLKTNCDHITPPGPSPQRTACENQLNDLDVDKDAYFAEQSKLLTALNDFIANPPAVTLSTSEVLSNKEDVSISWENKSSFKYPFVVDINEVSFKFNVYDFAIEGSNDTTSGQRFGRNKRMPGPNESGSGNENLMNFDIARYSDGTFKQMDTEKADGTNINSVGSWKTLKTYDQTWTDPEPPGNYPVDPDISYPVDGISVATAKELDANCDIDTNALPPTSWDVSFTDNTQFSWLYNVTNPGITITDPSQVQPMPSYTFTLQDMEVGNYQGVPTRSIVLDCIVPSSIDMVFGFYVCETLTIQSRTTPLNMVGTFIVKNLNIHSSAQNAGVKFYSIWSGGGIELLRQKRHLRRERAATEECTFTQPGWYTGLDEDTLADYQACSPAKFLYTGANNFNWTTIDPEIGITGTGAQVTTQSKVMNRYRRYGLSVIWQRSGVE